MKVKLKKALSLLLALVMCLGMLPGMALADGENEAKIGNTEYATLSAAINAGSGKTVKLLKDATLTARTTLKDNSVLDLDEHKIYLNGGSLSTGSYQNKTVTITNGTIVVQNGSSYAIQLGGQTYGGTKATISDLTIDKQNDSYYFGTTGICVQSAHANEEPDDPSILIRNVSINGKGTGIEIQNSQGVKIDNCTIESTNKYAIYNYYQTASAGSHSEAIITDSTLSSSASSYETIYWTDGTLTLENTSVTNSGTAVKMQNSVQPGGAEPDVLIVKGSSVINGKLSNTATHTDNINFYNGVKLDQDAFDSLKNWKGDGVITIPEGCGWNGPDADQKYFLTDKLFFDKTDLSVFAGDTANITAGGTEASSITWNTSNESVATVDNGTVTGVAKGTATITATSGDYSAACTVTVGDYAACIGEEKYETLQDAIDHADDGQTIVLLNNLTESVLIKNGINVIIDLNGHTITNADYNGDTLNVFRSATMKLTDSSTGVKGTVISTSSAAIWSGAGSNDTSNITVEGGVVLQGGKYGVQVEDGHAVTVAISDASVTGGTSALYIGPGSSCTITGGTYSSDPSSYVDAENYVVSGPNNGYYTVTPANAPAADFSGSGTEESPYLIDSAEQLAAMCDAINGENSAKFASAYWKLNADIDLNNQNWEPIGKDYYKSGKYTGGYKTGKAFTGTFDGGDHKISNLKVVMPADPDDTANGGGWAAGLFGIVKNGTVKNLTIENANVSSETRFAGAVAGGVTGGTIQNCTVQGTVDISSRHFVGGIAGMSYGTIKDCSVTATGTISANDTRELANEADRDGDDVGGIVGYINSTGKVESSTVSSTDLTVQGIRQVGAVVGMIDKGNVDAASTSNAKIARIINSKAQLEAFRDEVNAGNDFAGVTVKLNADIGLNNQNWEPIGKDYYKSGKYTGGYKTGKAFTGTFDGGDHKISNLKVVMPADPDDTANGGGWAAGLFGIVKNGTVKNLTIENANVSSETRFAGAVAGGVTGGTIQNCTVQGTVDISSRHFVGGIAGMSYGTITGCSVTASGRIHAYDATGEDGDDVGGIVGYSTGTVTGNTVNATTGTLTVEGQRSVDTVVGAKYGTISDNTGSANVIYNIETLRQLEAFRDEVNAGRDFAGAIVNLNKDITLTGIWTPIGYSKRITAANNPTYTTLLNADPYFAGTFDGHNHTISGLSNYNGNDAYTPIAASIDSNAYVYGLFGVAGNGAVLKDVNFTNVAIDTTKTSGLSGDSVGTLVGYTFGNVTVDDVTVNGSIKGSEGVGAIVGRIYQGRFTTDRAVSLTNCSATATVSGDGTAKSKVSGLFGYIADHGKNQLYLTMTGNTFTGTESGGTFNSQIACLNTTLYNHAGYVTISGNKHGTLDTQSAIAQDGTDNIVVFEDVAATFIGKTDAEIASEIDEKDKVVVLDTTGNSNAETNTSYAAEKTTVNNETVVTKYEVKVAETAPVAKAVVTTAQVSSVKTDSVIAKAKDADVITTGGNNTIELFVKADDSNSSSASDTITYEVDPYAIVNGDTNNPVKLSNNDLSSTASFTFSVDAPSGVANGEYVKVVHFWEQDENHTTAGSEDLGNIKVVNGKVTVTLKTFSSLSLTKSNEFVPEIATGLTWNTVNWVYRNYLNLQDVILFNTQVYVAEGDTLAYTFYNSNTSQVETVYFTISELTAYSDSAAQTALAANGVYASKTDSEGFYEVKQRVFPADLWRSATLQVLSGGQNGTVQDLYQSADGLTFYSLPNDNTVYENSAYTWLQNVAANGSSDTAKAVATNLLAYGKSVSAYNALIMHQDDLWPTD